MDDVKDKMKGFMKKVNNPFSTSSSGRFKGQGRVLGSSSSGKDNSIAARYSQNPNSRPQNNPASVSPVKSNPSPEKPLNSVQNRSEVSTTLCPDRKPNPDSKPNPDRKPTNGFDPFDSLITSSKVSKNGYSLNVYECPICGKSYGTEEEVSEHVDVCVNNSVNYSREEGVAESPNNGVAESHRELEVCVGTFLSGNPSEGSLEVVLKLLRNIGREPENPKFRRIRMSNPKIREAIAEVTGGVDLLDFVGFQLREEDGEMWAIMEVPKEEGINLINKVVALLEPKKVEQPQEKGRTSSMDSSEGDEPAESEKIDRQTRVFFSVPESVAAKIELPDSFYKLSVSELKREAEMRKKKIEESQLLIPKSFREKEAKVARRKYKRTVIRIQFPDKVVLQGVFAPWESTSALYEFVSSSLKEPCLEFELLHPVPVLVKRAVIPHFPEPGQKARTLEDEELVPSALIKFKPIETDSICFTGLHNELLQIMEPLNP